MKSHTNYDSNMVAYSITHGQNWATNRQKSGINQTNRPRFGGAAWRGERRTARTLVRASHQRACPSFGPRRMKTSVVGAHALSAHPTFIRSPRSATYVRARFRIRRAARAAVATYERKRTLPTRSACCGRGRTLLLRPRLWADGICSRRRSARGLPARIARARTVHTRRACAPPSFFDRKCEFPPISAPFFVFDPKCVENA